MGVGALLVPLGITAANAEETEAAVSAVVKKTILCMCLRRMQPVSSVGCKALQHLTSAGYPTFVEVRMATPALN